MSEHSKSGLAALTIADRTNPRAIAERFASRLFQSPAPWVRNGKLHSVTREMLRDLLEEVVAIGMDCGRATAPIGAALLGTLSPADGVRLVDAVKRSNEGREPAETAEEWAVHAILDCLAASEDAAGLARCEGCKKVLPIEEMRASHAEEDSVYLCAPCADGIGADSPGGATEGSS